MTTDAEDDITSSKSCFSGIIRRILCTGSLPTHPSNSDVVPESDMVLEKRNFQVKGQGTPGVVARLMGLESLPDIKRIPKDAMNFRSRSVRSADYFPVFDHLSQESRHRRLKTSVSFREIPTFLHRQNEDLFVVCFDERNNGNATGLDMMAGPDEVVGFQHMKRSSLKGKGSGEEERKTRKQENKKRNPEPKRSSLKANNILPYYNKSNEVYIRPSPRLKKKRATKPPNSFCEEVSSGMKHARMRENKRTTPRARIESTGSSSESSTTTSEKSRKTGLNSNAKKYCIPKPEKVEYPCLNNACRRSNADDDQEVTSANHITESDGSVKSQEIDFYIKDFVQVCRLNEEDTKNSHDWQWIKSETTKLEDSEEICLDFEQHILDLLLQQVVDELR